MKALKYIIIVLMLSFFCMALYNCGEDDEPKSKKEELTEYLVNKTSDWKLRSITVPNNSATTEDQWVDFKLSVSSTTMSTSGHPSGAIAVWPTGSWTMNESGNTITRADGVVMSVLTLTATNFRVSFSVPEGTNIEGRIAALDGDYIFDLE